MRRAGGSAVYRRREKISTYGDELADHLTGSQVTRHEIGRNRRRVVLGTEVRDPDRD
jgi:hypothetical protein